MPDRHDRADDEFERRLAQRLRAYESRIPDADVPPPGTRPARAPRWPWLVGGGAAAIVAGAALALAMLRPSADEVGQASPTMTASTGPASPTLTAEASPSLVPTPVVTPMPTPTPSPEPTPIPSGAAPITWREGRAAGEVVHDVIWFGDRWVAAGSAGQARAGVWTSTDGLNWEATAPLEPEPVHDLDAMTGYWITTLVEFDGELLAFGWNRIGCCDGGRPAMWRSSDGRQWAYVDTSGTALETYAFPADTVRTPSGELLLLGGTGLGGGTSVFLSPNGTTWEEITVTAADSLDRMDRVATSGTLLVGVGNTDDGPGDAAGQLVMVSSDGRTWERVPPPSITGLLGSIAWDPLRERFVAGGTDTEGRPGVWLSADARSWTRVTFSDQPGSVSGIDAAEGLIVAIGSIGPALEAQAMAWSSHDGVTWQINPLGAPNQGGLVVATAHRQAVIWMNGWSPPPVNEPMNRVWSGVLEP
jgi:hypothetical protein